MGGTFPARLQPHTLERAWQGLLPPPQPVGSYMAHLICKHVVCTLLSDPWDC